MNKKYFVLNEKLTPLSQEDIATIEKSKSDSLKVGYEKNRCTTKERLSKEEYSFRHTDGRIIISIDLDYKNSHTFEDGTKIYVGRQFNNLNRRETEPVNATVVDSEYVPKGVEILIHPNSIHDSNRIFGYDKRGVEDGNALRYYSIEETSAFVYREEKEWKPLRNFCTALRVFKPYTGSIKGILPEVLKNVLYITSGEYKGLCVHTLKACDYCIIFMDANGRESRVIRCRHYENEYHDREELICIDYSLTEKVNKGELLIGLSPTDCK